MSKMRCYKCRWLNWDFISQKQEPPTEGYYCGLHGREKVDPEGEQKNLNNNGGCGFWAVEGYDVKQLAFEF